MARATSIELEPVAAVCGNEVRIYGPVNGYGVRPFRSAHVFAHRGAALLYACEFDEPAKPVAPVKQRATA